MGTGSGQMGVRSRLLFDTALPFSNTSRWFEFMSESINSERLIINNAGLRGTRAQASERNRFGNEKVSGTLNFELSRILMDNILPAVMGAVKATNTFNPAETLPKHYWMIDKGTDVVIVNETIAGKMTISGSQSEIIKVALDVEAESMTTGASWPVASPSPDVSSPYFFADTNNVTLKGTARQIFSFDLAIDNALSANQWANNLTRDEFILPSDRIVTLTMAVPATAANADLQAGSVVTGEELSLVFVNNDSTDEFKIHLGRYAFNVGVPMINGKGQQVLPISGVSRAAGHAGATAKDLYFENIPAPDPEA
ncbi:phage tail tube protein [Planctomicrobium sp. SH668]|uniref:phage tail tube protein n=1 Tax=Planctomicrobium sp. SH668 TaxID=3448126 RepID=UPI003F5C23D8